MSAVLKSFTIFALMLSVQARPVTTPKVRATVRIYVYDYTGVSESEQKQAEAVITRLLDEAGIGVMIFQCSSIGERYATPDCLRRLGAVDLVVRIMPGDRRDRTRRLGDSFGTWLATIYYQRAVAFAAKEPASQRVPTGQILGYGTAHEIGHLLLASNAHSPIGVMRAEWSIEELKLIRSSSLYCTAEQAAAMRVEVSRRTQRIEVTNSIE